MLIFGIGVGIAVLLVIVDIVLSARAGAWDRPIVEDARRLPTVVLIRTDDMRADISRALERSDQATRWN